MKEGSIAQRADQENTASMLIFHIWVQVLIIRVKKGTSMPCSRQWPTMTYDNMKQKDIVFLPL